MTPTEPSARECVPESATEQLDDVQHSLVLAQLALEDHKVLIADTAYSILKCFKDEKAELLEKHGQLPARVVGIRWSHARTRAAEVAKWAKTHGSQHGKLRLWLTLDENMKEVKALAAQLIELCADAFEALRLIRREFRARRYSYGDWIRILGLKSFNGSGTDNVDESLKAQLAVWNEFCELTRDQKSAALATRPRRDEYRLCALIGAATDILANLDITPGGEETVPNMFSNATQSLVQEYLIKFVKRAWPPGAAAALGHSSGGAFFPQSRRQHRVER